MQKIKVFAEIGINHNGEFTVARDLITAAAEVGVAGVKFQYRNLANAYAEGPKQIGDEILFKEITKNYLAPSDIIRLVEYAHGLGLEAGISFFDVADMADFRTDICLFDFFKVPSVELNNCDMVNAMLQYDKQVYLSLGCQSESEIENAFASFNGANWLAMHCVSNYPVSLPNAKLGYLKHMAATWGRDFGYSSHDENWEVCLIAMSMGASVIERHITFDKQAQGLDHSTSSTPDEFRRIVMFAENMLLILSGDGPRIPNQGEKLNLQNLGRSYYAKDCIDIGQAVTLEKLTLRAPCIGLGRTEMQQYLGKSPAKRIETGMVLSRSTFEAAPQVSEAALDYARKQRVALPVRLHDQASIEAKFPIGAFEFHLSFGEVLAGLSAAQYGKHNYYSVHLPDYINSTQLMDPFSPEAGQADASRNILQRTADFAKSLQDLTGKPVPIVGSFSVVHKDIEQFYEQHATLISDYEREGVSILPQWLPPIAWYFGGSVKLNAFNQTRDVELIRKHMLPICMDVCHLCMGDSLYDFGATEVIGNLMPNIRHIHIADADGIDGEGLQFGEGAPGNMAAIDMAMNIDCMKVIEVWQGHLDGGAGFAIALTRLAELFDEE